MQENMDNRSDGHESYKRRNKIQKVDEMENKTINIWLTFNTTVIRDTINNPIYDVCDLSVTSVLTYLIFCKEKVCGYRQRKVRGANNGLWIPRERSAENPLLILKWVKKLFSRET